MRTSRGTCREHFFPSVAVGLPFLENESSQSLHKCFPFLLYPGSFNTISTNKYRLVSNCEPSSRWPLFAPIQAIQNSSQVLSVEFAYLRKDFRLVVLQILKKLPRIWPPITKSSLPFFNSFLPPLVYRKHARLISIGALLKTAKQGFYFLDGLAEEIRHGFLTLVG
jgi:hypothetical protein